MDRAPSPLLIGTFIFAAILKIVGVGAAAATAYVTSGTWALNRWWMALTTGAIMLLLLLPWDRWFHRPRLRTYQLPIALCFAILAQPIDVIQSSGVPYADLAANDGFQTLLGWSMQEINNVHALGLMFTMVPVVLASWHYGVPGMLGSLALAGLVYVTLPLALPRDAFNWWFYAVRGFVLLGMTLILAFVVGTLASAQRRREMQLADTNAQLEAANEKLARQAVLMEQLATSRERNRLARELHDTLAHSLSGTAVQLQAVQTLIKVDTQAASAELASARSQIKQGLTESRRAIAALRSTPLEELGLSEAIRQHADTIAARNELALTADIGRVPNLDPLVEQTFYRIADESLINIERHAQATAINMTLNTVNGEVTLAVQDDGVGFDIAIVDDSGRFGIMGMRERAELIGAMLEITSRPSGTSVELRYRHV